MLTIKNRKKEKNEKIFKKSKKFALARIRTEGAGFKVLSDNQLHYKSWFFWDDNEAKFDIYKLRQLEKDFQYFYLKKIFYFLLFRKKREEKNEKKRRNIKWLIKTLIN